MTILILDEFVDTSLATLMQAADDNRTSVMAIEARDFSPETVTGRLMALARVGAHSVIKFQGGRWAGARGQACIVFHDEKDRARMRISHHSHHKSLKAQLLAIPNKAFNPQPSACWHLRTINTMCQGVLSGFA